MWHNVTLTQNSLGLCFIKTNGIIERVKNSLVSQTVTMLGVEMRTEYRLLTLTQQANSNNPQKILKLNG